MSDFFNSIILTFSDFGKDLGDFFSSPLDVLANYSPYSTMIIAAFIVSKFVTDAIFVAIDSEVPKRMKERGFFVLHIVIMMVAFFIDYVNMCDQKFDFGEGFKESIFLVAPVYIMLWVIQKFPGYSKARSTIPAYGACLLEGFVLFMVYNWAMNFRKKFGYIACDKITDDDIESAVLDKQKEAIKQGKWKLFSSQPDLSDEVKSTTTTTTVTTTMQNTRGPVITTDNEKSEKSYNNEGSGSNSSGSGNDKNNKSGSGNDKSSGSGNDKSSSGNDKSGSGNDKSSSGNDKSGSGSDSDSGKSKLDLLVEEINKAKLDSKTSGKNKNKGSGPIVTKNVSDGQNKIAKLKEDDSDKTFPIIILSVLIILLIALVIAHFWKRYKVRNNRRPMIITHTDEIAATGAALESSSASHPRFIDVSGFRDELKGISAKHKQKRKKNVKKLVDSREKMREKVDGGDDKKEEMKESEVKHGDNVGDEKTMPNVDVKAMPAAAKSNLKIPLVHPNPYHNDDSSNSSSESDDDDIISTPKQSHDEEEMKEIMTTPSPTKGGKGHAKETRDADYSSSSSSSTDSEEDNSSGGETQQKIDNIVSDKKFSGIM